MWFSNTCQMEAVMNRKWLVSALPVFAFVIGSSSVLAIDAWDVGVRSPVTELTITLGATVMPFIGIDEDGKEVGQAFSAITRFIDIDEDGAELDQVAIVAPLRLNLVEGKHYQLKIVNASASTHYIWAPEFDALSAQTTQISVDKGKVGNRVTGAPEEEYLTAETEIQPGGTAVWEFVPQMAGTFKWGCSIPSHADAGMKGELVVAPAMTG